MRAALCTVLLAWLAGCAADPTTGWTTLATFPDGIDSISVPIAENRTFVRDVEFTLTDAIAKRIQTTTPYRLATNRRADTILLVTIREVVLDPLSQSPLTGLGEEVLVGMTIDFEWRRLATDELLVERRAFTGHGLFVPSAPASERLELGTLVVVDQLAEDLVNELRSGW